MGQCHCREARSTRRLRTRARRTRHVAVRRPGLRRQDLRVVASAQRLHRTARSRGGVCGHDHCRTGGYASPVGALRQFHQPLRRGIGTGGDLASGGRATRGRIPSQLRIGGQCHLDPFVARTIRDLPDVDIVSIKTGINIVNMDSMRERVFAPALHGFLDTIREAKPDVPITVISPIYCPSAETRPGPTIPDGQGRFVTIDGFEQFRNGCLSLVRIREIIADVVDKRRTAGDPALHYVDGLTLFGAEDAHDLPDDLHPNPAGYRRMGERFAPGLAQLAATLD
ncbi:MAG: hypothetical protein F4169_21365 [Gammaproteobacteria bacterium]|nr:hypothetical protein [Gammaproteobacteria bacterium]